MTVVTMLQGELASDEQCLRTGLYFARRLATDLSAVCALPDPQNAIMLVTTPESVGLSGAAVSSAIELQEQVLAQARKAFDAVGAGAGPVPARFEHHVGTAETAAANAAILAHAVVFPRDAARAGTSLSIAFNHVLMEARLPVVLAGTRAIADGPVIIAWDGSNGASRALRLHADILRSAPAILVAQNRRDAERDGARPFLSAEALCQWISDRGMTARSVPLDGEVAKGLLALSAAEGASAIIAGAYGHSRLGERLFGGTSRRLLDAEDAPALALAR